MKYELEWSSDGCPNNCAYCRENGYSCVYKDADSPLKNKPYTCSICGKKLAADECYSYKDFDFCQLPRPIKGSGLAKGPIPLYLSVVCSSYIWS